MQWHWIFTFILTVIQITGWLLIPKALLIARTPQAALGWSMALFFLPLITIPLFLIFGESRFSGYQLAGNGSIAPLDDLLRRTQTTLQPFQAEFDAKYADVALLVKQLRHLPATHGNSAELLIDGTATFAAIFAAIDRAQAFILVQFFIIRNDRLGNELKQRLLAAAQRGVKVYMLFDSVGSKNITLDYISDLRRAGISIQGFVTNRQLGMRFQIQFRNHRKLVLVDGHIAFIGGLNAAEEYCTGGRHFASWRDTHLALRGPAVTAMQVNFTEDWFYATDQFLDLSFPPPEPQPDNRRIAVFASGPADKCNICEMVYAAVIAATRKRLWLASPYFVPDLALRQTLAQAAVRGVDVRILLPQHADHRLPWLSSFSYYPVMRDAGVQIYRYQPGFMHQKILLADDDFAIVGSVNTDYRSFMLNFELSAAVNDRTFAAEVEHMLLRDFARANKENMNLFDEANLLFKLRVKIAQLSSPEQ